MKILHVIPSYEPAWAFGGTVTATSNLCRALTQKGIDVTVYTTDADGMGGYLNVRLNEPVDLGGVKVWYFHCDLLPKKAFYSRELASKLKETVKEFDLVHMSAIWQWIGVDVYKICNLYNRPYILSTHGSFNPWPWNQNIFRKRIYWYLFSKNTIKNATSIHFTAEEEREKSLANIPLLKTKRSFIIPNGIEIKNNLQNREDIRKKLNIPSKKFLLLFVGRIHRKKGLHFIINALKILQNNKIAFLIVGNKEDKKYVEYLFELSKSLNSNLFWHEQVSRDKIWDFYFSSNLLTLTSYDENFGYTAVEAMSCGLPVLITKNVCIWREIESDKTGFVVSQDSNEIAEILKKCVETPDILKKLSINACKSAEERYDINKVADLMIKAYEDVLTGIRSPGLQWK